MAKKQKKSHEAPRLKKRKASRKAAVIKVTVRTAAKQAAPRPMSAAATPFSADQLQKVREVLTRKRDDLLAVVQRKKEEEIEDIGVGDEADVAMHSVEKEMLFELTDTEKQTLDMVEAALRKMDKNAYGVCESCQRGIPRMRLQVMPWARYCVTCQTEQEAPVSE
ncbi:MAG: hypothetical protein A2992_05655 [Elusimicrobia bacterium RIFCSPLOWO2_01_FULL_59_12]|nr:MAG: hypothetical protein A2992_05655 [Elusimicrobia bacterium RIFCSPLOWO2_01_FULL_59_12]